MLYPLSLNLSHMVPEPTDPLLNSWRMQWNAQAWLRGPEGVANLFNTNIFYPFPLTLAYSEHFLLETALALPFLLSVDSHLFGLNLSVLSTFVLSAMAMYLLVTAWTGRRWAGLVAGLLFAFSPHRFGQLNHLELLVTQWLPLALLALHWTLTRPGWRYPVLFGLFFNLQALSGFHFTLNLAIASALLALVYALTGRVRWRGGVWWAAALTVIVTLLLNWPIWRMYLRFSDVMGAVRTPGEVRIYSAALTDYLTTIPHNLLYGWTFGRWQAADHQIQPLMPFGLVGLGLALTGLGFWILDFRFWTARLTGVDLRLTIDDGVGGVGERASYGRPTIIFLVLLTLLALLLSFGLNEQALGPGLADLLKFSPYVWLYENVTFFQGIRVPGRFGILVVIGLVGLAGWGVAGLSGSRWQGWRRFQPILAGGLIGLILLEAWSAPLIGPEFPAGPAIPPVYQWLANETGPETVVLELPFQGPSEFAYEYYSSYHWRRLANGGTGFTPPIYKELREWFQTFPDGRSVDVIQQMGIDLVILHPASYQPEAWQRLSADLPLYLPAFSQLHQSGDALVLRVAKPSCQAEADLIGVTLDPAVELDGLANAVEVTYHNRGQAAFVADVRQASQLTFADQADKSFTEPLVTPAGESQPVVVPLPRDNPALTLSGAWLATLNRLVSTTEPTLAANPAEAMSEETASPWQPLNLNFAGGPQLVAYRLNPAVVTACSRLSLALNWTGGQPGDTATVQLLDPFGRVALEHKAQPWSEGHPDGNDVRTLPVVGSRPAGRYGLRIYVHTAEGQERPPITAEGVTIPTDQIPPLPLVIHPVPPALEPTNEASVPLFGEVIRLVGSQLPPEAVRAGDWLRFSLVWQIDQPLAKDLTVFTQLLGPDGQVWGQRDNQPGGGWYSTSLWLPGRPVEDHYAFQLGAEAPPGVYRLIAGWYDSATLERLPVQTAAGGGDFVEIGTVQVVSRPTNEPVNGR